MNKITDINSARKVDGEYTIQQQPFTLLDWTQQLFVTGRDGPEAVIKGVESSKMYDLIPYNNLMYWFASTGNLGIYRQYEATLISEVGRMISAMYASDILRPIAVEFADIGNVLGCYIHPSGLIIINPIFMLQYPDVISKITIPHEICHVKCAQLSPTPIFGHGEIFNNHWELLFGGNKYYQNAEFTGMSRAKILSNMQFLLNKFAEDGFNVSDIE